MHNILIDQHFKDYLIVNGYRFSQDSDGVSFTNRDKSVSIKGDTAKFWCYYDGSDDEAPDFSEYGSISGVSQLDIFGWMMVLHAFGVVTLKKFIQEARKEVPDMFEQMADIFRPVEYPTLQTHY